MTKIKFGTDGWRAIIAEDFTVENVTRVAEATAEWLFKNYSSPSVIVGYDCRFAGKLFADTVAKVMVAKKIKTFASKGFVSTPMISLGAVEFKTNLGIIITASHNPPEYNGFKLKGGFGGPLQVKYVTEIENLIKSEAGIDTKTMLMEDTEKSGLLEYVDLETLYCKRVENNFDLNAIRKSGLRLGYDAMYGAGQNVIKRIFPEATLLHCDYNPSFKGQAPEPIHKNLKEFCELIKSSGRIDLGLITDGDADRIGLYDSKGNFIDSHHIILLLIHYLYKYKGMTGKVCVAFSTTSKVEKLCRHYILPFQVLKIGFKYIAEVMITEDCLLGGEESGGIAVKGHIPERDGIWMGLILLEFMAKTGKNLNELIKEVYDITGSFAFERSDLHIREEIKQRVLEKCKSGSYTSFGNFKVSKVEDMDGWKFHFENGDWLMIRASGTEPVLRTYAESANHDGAVAILKASEKTLLA